MSGEYYIINKYAAAAKVSAAFALVAFFLTLFTGLLCENYITYVILRSSMAMLIFGILGYLLGYLLANTFTKRQEEEIHDSEI
jgi:hypothetical protein